MNNFLGLKTIFMLSLVLVFGITFFPSSVYSDTQNTGVFPKDSSPFGIPYGEWLARWWQWNMAIPPDVHPREHFSEQTCVVNQDGPVWFLPNILSGKEDRTCTIPAGKAILVPLLTGEQHNGPAEHMSDAEIIQKAKQGNEYGVVKATLDGRVINNLTQYRTEYGFFNITIPKNNIYNNDPGTFRGYVDGFFVFLEPLSPGKHTLSLSTSVNNPIDVEYNYAGVVNYNLMMKP